MSKKEVMLHVDTSDVAELIGLMRKVHTEQKFKQIMRHAFRDAATRTKTLLKKEIPGDYQAKPAWIGRQIGKGSTSVGHEVTCTIPVQGVRGYIGRGGIYNAVAKDSAGTNIRKGYASRGRKKTRKSYKISAQVVTGATSVLPGRGKAIHFMVFSGPNKGRVYARLDRKGKRIRPATGIGVPQMPTNRTKKAVQDGVVNLLKTRIVHHHGAMIKGYIKDRRSSGRK